MFISCCEKRPYENGNFCLLRLSEGDQNPTAGVCFKYATEEDSVQFHYHVQFHYDVQFQSAKTKTELGNSNS